MKHVPTLIHKIYPVTITCPDASRRIDSFWQAYRSSSIDLSHFYMMGLQFRNLFLDGFAMWIMVKEEHYENSIIIDHVYEGSPPHYISPLIPAKQVSNRCGDTYKSVVSILIAALAP